MDNTSHCIVDWPQWWRGKGHHLLEGMPIIGTHRKVIRHVTQCLGCRSDALFNSIWGKSRYPVDQCRFVADEVGKVVKAYVAWPNFLFLPGDRVALLLGVIPGVWYDAEDPVEDVRKRFHLQGVKDGEESYHDIVLTGKFEELFDAIIQANQFGDSGDKKLC